MTVESESIEIDPCPCCGQRHRYEVDVTRSAVANLLPAAGDAPRERSWTRLFTCPVAGENFQAELVLQVAPGTRIRDVAVGGVEDEPDG